MIINTERMIAPDMFLLFVVLAIFYLRSKMSMRGEFETVRSVLTLCGASLEFQGQSLIMFFLQHVI